MILSKFLKQIKKWYTALRSGINWQGIPFVMKSEENLTQTFVPEKSLSLLSDERPEERVECTGKRSVRPGFSNVCFAESLEVRDDYKTTTLADDYKKG